MFRNPLCPFTTSTCPLLPAALSSSYGLPPDFVVKVLKYEKGSIKRLRSALEQLYGHLDKAAGSKADVSETAFHKARTLDRAPIQSPHTPPLSSPIDD